MRRIIMKSTTLWTNIGDIAVVNGKIASSVYKCAYFHDNHSYSPQAPIVLRQRFFLIDAKTFLPGDRVVAGYFYAHF